MYVLQDEAVTQLRIGATLDVVMEIFENGNGPMIASSYSDPRLNIDTTKGGIEAARKATYARQFSATIIDPDGSFVPKVTQPYLDPLRRPWVRIYWDIYWQDTYHRFSYQRVPTGVFALEKCVAKESAGGVELDCSGNDIAVFIAQNPWAEQFTVSDSLTTGTQKYHEAIRSIITDRANWTPVFRFEESDKDCPEATFDTSADPWAEAQKLAEAAGMELFVDMTGSFVLRAVPDPKKLDSCWFYDESEFSRRTDGMDRTVDIANAYNGVRVNASATWLLYPIVGIAWDTDPASPTYYKGPMGMRAKTIDNNLVGDQTAADDAAAAELLNVLGVNEEMSFEAVINPAHEIGDVVTIGSEILDVQDKVLLETFSLQFSVTDTMKGTCRRQRRA